MSIKNPKLSHHCQKLPVASYRASPSSSLASSFSHYSSTPASHFFLASTTSNINHHAFSSFRREHFLYQPKHPPSLYLLSPCSNAKFPSPTSLLTKSITTVASFGIWRLLFSNDRHPWEAPAVAAWPPTTATTKTPPAAAVATAAAVTTTTS